MHHSFEFSQSSDRPKGFRELPHFEGMTLFHEDWWLNAVTSGAYEKIAIQEDGKLLGFLPLHITREYGQKVCRMPPLTHLLGPVVDVGQTDEAGQRQRRFDVTSQLLEKLPTLTLFRQVLSDEIPDALAFQAANCQASHHYTLLLDCSNLDLVWSGFRQNMRRGIRKLQSQCEVVSFQDAEKFRDFYIRNLLARNRTVKKELNIFPALYDACRERDCGEVFAIVDDAGALSAGIFVVWGHGRMYYLMTSRDINNNTHGLVSVLIWHAIHEASRRNLIFDLDGIASVNLFRFLNGFGGTLRSRTIVQRQSTAFDILQIGRKILGGTTSAFY